MEVLGLCAAGVGGEIEDQKDDAAHEEAKELNPASGRHDGGMRIPSRRRS